MDVNRARKAELIDLAEKLGLDTDGTVIELRKRLMDYEEAHDTLDEDDVEETEMEAVKDSEGAVAEMFPELETLSDEDVDQAIDEGRRKLTEDEEFSKDEIVADLLEDTAKILEEELDEVEAESDAEDAEAVEAEIPDVPLAGKVHTPLEPCKNCGTDLERFPPFFDPESVASRCPNCGHGL
ncbi:MAG: SAP domain-containing protein [Candidatus Thermoplasmatota archaeon]|nr:SAP domain-containing protein [Candidatus Thermoplasmatota archaeon]